MVIMAACTSDSDVEVTDEEGNTEETNTGGDLVASYATDVSSLDPAGQNDLPSDQRRNVIYEGLLYFEVLYSIQQHQNFGIDQCVNIEVDS